MRARDPRRDAAYFERQLRADEATIRQFREQIAAPDTAAEHREMLRHAVYRSELEQLVMRYSGGAPISDMRAHYPRVIDALAEYNSEPARDGGDFTSLDDYVRALWLAALGVLLDVDDQTFRRALREIDNEGRDAIYERLVALRVPGRTTPQTVMHPDPYGALFDALDPKRADRGAAVARFLDRWYAGLSNAYWHDSHLGEDSGYFGYWCFELAAFVRAMRIDDAAFADDRYYPRDLVHDGDSKRAS
jgi:Domain of unknown function (DUF1911)/Domain of unknown function (DUF1910)